MEISSAIRPKRVLPVKQLIWVALFYGLLATGEAFAATQGTLGNPSTGTDNISITIPKLIIITQLADLSLGSYSGVGILEANRNVSIAVNMKSSGTQKYTVTATGSCTGNSPLNAFNVSNGATLIPYTVFFNAAIGTTGEVQLTSNTSSATLSGAAFGLSSTTLNANYHVKFAAPVLQAAVSGNYTGTLTLVVRPQ